MNRKLAADLLKAKGIVLEGVPGSAAPGGDGVKSPHDGMCVHDSVRQEQAEAAMHETESASHCILPTSPDPLTGLHGRRTLRQLLKAAIDQAVAGATTVSVLVIGLDRLKRVNDHLGHEAGDEVIRLMGKRISHAAGYAFSIGRLGGDEFAGFLVEPSMKGADTLRIARLIRAAVAEPVTVRGQEIFCTCSIGLASYPEDAREVTGLIGGACAALDRAKQRGGNQVRFYSASICERDSEALLLESALHHAVANDEIDVHYQPRVDVRSGSIVGAEALARWQNPQFGAVGPARFIPIAERSGLIQTLSDQVLRTTCQQHRTWSESCRSLGNVSVNLSPCQLQRPGLSGRLHRIIDEFQMDPQVLEFEITETTLLKDPDSAARVMCELKELGVQLALDDFGTGYSSLYHLKRFPIDTLKIDRSFIEVLSTDFQTFVIVEGTIAMAHKMGMVVVGEGVSAAAEERILSELGCDQIQGNFHSPPVDGAKFGQLMTERSAER